MICKKNRLQLRRAVWGTIYSVKGKKFDLVCSLCVSLLFLMIRMSIQVGALEFNVFDIQVCVFLFLSFAVISLQFCYDDDEIHMISSHSEKVNRFVELFVINSRSRVLNRFVSSFQHTVIRTITRSKSKFKSWIHETFQSDAKSSCKASVSDEKHTAPTAPMTYPQWTLGEN